MRSAAGVARAMVAPVLLLLAGALLADCHGSDRYLPSNRLVRALSRPDAEAGCLHEGRWHATGAAVRTRESCLECACGAGALSCRRRACPALPEPPPRCHVLHRRGECCPEMRCADGVKHHEARLDDTAVDTPTSIGHACVEGSTVYAAGSAMSAGSACEQCFCLGGRRRCVRPRCLPPPPGCRARPAAGACCPQRYYCEHLPTKPQDDKAARDCITPNGAWVMEGERVKASEVGLKCIQCFCLRGSVRCQHLSCAPSLHGCAPLVQPGQCCPHQYQCDRRTNGTKTLHPHHLNILNALRDEDRSFHTAKSTKRETTMKGLTTVTDKSTEAVTVTKKDSVSTADVTKVKRQNEEPVMSSSVKTETSTLATAQATQRITEMTPTTVTESTTFEESFDELPTEQPEGSVKVIINGTINCTAEISSTSLIFNVSDTNDTMWIDSQTQPRIPIINAIENDDHTFPPNEIITEGSYNEGFDDNETFTINVTSSLRTNTTHSSSTTIKPLPVLPKTVPPVLFGKVNVSKIKKDEYDYDYTQPTLPPSLPNLKIIPFVAADAVVEDDISSKESLDYNIELDREDKFPVYYPTNEAKETIYATNKEDTYSPTQYPIFISKKVEPKYPSLTQESEAMRVPFPAITNAMPAPVQEYTVTASMGNSANVNYKDENKSSAVSKEFEVKPPAVNLFSPPVETEGGFIPKGPGIIDDYYSMYPSTPSGNIVPHLTTSMQLEPKDECISSDGRRVSDGESISYSCSICSCAWGQLHCAPRPCNTPAGCWRKAATISTNDLCCGDLICEKMNMTTSMPLMIPQNTVNNVNSSEIINNHEKISFTYQDGTTTTRITTNNETGHKNITLEKHESQYSNNFGDLIPISLVPPVTSDKPISYTTEVPVHDMENSNHSLEYDEEDDDDGFSLGSVLKLLLSETYETTSTAPKKKFSTEMTSTSSKTTTAPVAPTTKKNQFTTSDGGFVPVTHRSPYLPPKKLYPPSAINRIDHLVLGEPSAIRNLTPKPIFRPPIVTSTKKVVTTAKTTPQPITTKTVEISSKEGFGGQPVEIRPPAPNFIPGFGLGLPKLAGCNIYGRMYRVGRIITELSSPCQECKCTELGVQCRSLNC